MYSLNKDVIIENKNSKGGFLPHFFVPSKIVAVCYTYGSRMLLFLRKSLRPFVLTDAVSFQFIIDMIWQREVHCITITRG